ncbi:MAG: 2,3-bisphosphoglycerate-independent phosphoglycerate mutase, partial [Acidobacteriota bacterium]|nr:2,3-bisphosphoglycerate-independent phosphoglycerate mutase [Acidobacteriota bacterium]
MPAGPAGPPASSAVLVVLDGWGLAPAGPGNAVSLARTPVFDALWERYPHTSLNAGGIAVGLPEGQMGNSEVGHMNLGAGAVVMQDLTRIDLAVADGALARNEVLRAAFSDIPAGGRVHLLGLVSDGGVHSSIEHLRALIELARELRVADLVIHAFTDGRDTLPHSGAGFLEQVEGWTAQAGVGRVGSVVGRYYAMDRDSRWQRIQLAYDLLVHGRAEHHAEGAAEALRAAYAREETDEFVKPVSVGAEARIRPGDSVLAFNFRPDRMREITRALAEPGFAEVDRGGAPALARYATMTEYEEGWPYPVAFRPARPEVTLPQVIAAHGGSQLHVAETEKYPHVTYFFNGGVETPYAGEERVLVPSQKVATYDLMPEMSAPGITDVLCTALEKRSHDFTLVNYANGDMVGHSGNLAATIRACEVVDQCLARVIAS